MLSAALSFPFQDLLVTANVLTLGIFALVDLTLWPSSIPADVTASGRQVGCLPQRLSLLLV